MERPFTDYYELLQLSPSADMETIQRVYRMLAQRYHPDNPETGSVDRFREISEAYHVLSNSEQRAAYDVTYLAQRGDRWRIFNQPAAAEGFEGEKRKRLGVLSLLYTKRMNEPEKPYLSLMEMENLLGCPREHLEFTLWYLRDTQCVSRSDNARYVITVKGVETIENQDESPLSKRRLLDGARDLSWDNPMSAVGR